MTHVIPFPIPTHPVFDPKTTALIVAAYDRVCTEMQDAGQPEMIKELIAKRLIQIAGNGERDPEHLWRGTLASLGLPHKPK